ncbi:MAG: cell division protein FtsW [Gammaproteobacteria bacterium RIFCSPLOWO2_02_FULL_42_9]|nr:MAG: cell division protein FtsW [Gammaproteobacteria bacterium RIFCSPLOWO2_02_FULL_42_9]
MRPIVKRQESTSLLVFDKYFMLSVLALLIIGLVMVMSASMAISERQFGQPFYYLFRQSIYVLLGVGATFVIVRIRTEVWFDRSGWILLLSILLLVLVMVPGIGHVVNGSRRWIGFSIFRLQVSEFVKIAFILYLGSYLVRHQEEVRADIGGFIKPLILLGVIGVLLLLEPDFGAAVVIAVTAFAMLFLGGARLWQFILLLALAVMAFVFLAISSPYRMARLTTFLNPWAHQFNSGYQLTQSLIAFGRGGIFGVGLGSSIQKLFYLPEAHTDFLFAVLGEELGLVGMLSVLFLYLVLVVRILWIGRRAQLMGQPMAGYVAYGVGIWIGIQALVNMGVNAGLFPTKGLTLPLISYGGSSMLIMFVALAIVLRIDYETRVSTNNAKLPKKKYARARYGF